MRPLLTIFQPLLISLDFPWSGKQVGEERLMGVRFKTFLTQKAQGRQDGSHSDPHSAINTASAAASPGSGQEDTAHVFCPPASLHSDSKWPSSSSLPYAAEKLSSFCPRAGGTEEGNYFTQGYI